MIVKDKRMFPNFPFGRFGLFFIITAILFGVCKYLFRELNLLFNIYAIIAGISLAAGTISFVLALIMILFFHTWLEPGYSFLHDSVFLDGLFCDVPYFRIMIVALVASILLSWVHDYVFPIGFTVFLISLEMVLARSLFFTYGSSGKH